MKLELTKHVEVSTGMGGKKPGEEVIWHWVRAYNGDVQVISEPFENDEMAIAYYNGLLEIYKKYKTFTPIPEVLFSEEIPS
jgi:hypothetical protein